MSSRFKNQDDVVLEELLSNTEIVVRSLCFAAMEAPMLRKGAGKKRRRDDGPSAIEKVSTEKAADSIDANDAIFLSKHRSSCPISSKSIVLCSVALSRLPTSVNAPLLWKILGSLLSLLLWAAAVLFLRHLRSADTLGTPPSGLWKPTEPIHAESVLATAPSIVTDLVTPSSSGAKILAKSKASRNNSPSAMWQLPTSFRPDLSTEDNYHADGADALCGQFVDIRREIDYNFHKFYSCQRQHFQDRLVESMLNSATDNREEENNESSTTSSACSTKDQSRRNWIVFTAGVMGAGKSFTMKQLYDRGHFPLDSFVTVDPDRVRRLLPEFDQYVHLAPDKAGELTRKESGLISEILTEAALRKGRNVLVDGTLRNCTWYQDYFDNLRERYPSLRLGILHVTAPRDAVLERAMNRAKITGRVVPRDLLERTLVEVPKSIQILSKKVDYAVELLNAPGSSEVEIATEGITWDSFRSTWKRPCSVAREAGRYFDSVREYEQRNRGSGAALFLRESPPLMGVPVA